MKTLLSSALLLMLSFIAFVQEAKFFEPYKNTDLRLPSVPLILNDPFISFWSPYDKLNEGYTTHWADIRKPMDGLLRVDGTVYRWMGKQETAVLGKPFLPMASDQAWSALAHIGTKPNGATTRWTNEDYETSTYFKAEQWSTLPGAFGCPKGKYDNGTKTCEDSWHTHVSTEWWKTGENNALYIRRHMTLTAEDLKKSFCIKYSHDDYFYLYINGRLVVNTGYTWAPNQLRELTAAEVARYLHEGDNVIAVKCLNQTGGAYCDFGIYENIKSNLPTEQMAVQNNYDVLACNTYYNFTCGPIDLDVVFTAPMAINDLDLISTPINYVTYRVRSNDGKAHDVQFYYSFTPEMTVFDIVATRSQYVNNNGVRYVQAGSTAQPILRTAGDLRSIDWGYIYLPEINGEVAMADVNTSESEFAKYGRIVNPRNGTVRAQTYDKYPVISLTKDFGSVTEGASYMMLGYDEVKDIHLWGKDYKGYWARNGKTIFQAFEEYKNNYGHNMMQARDMDKIIYDDAFNTGGKKYAEMLSGTYRHVLAAHKLFEDEDGDLMYFSKENNSNGCVNTVDLTYPSAPLFLAYNPQLAKGMITSILKYTKSRRWDFDFAAHDLGTYPHANGNVYGNPWANDGSTMPLEENANIITLAAFIAKQDGDMEYIEKYWDVITRWKKYLVDNGKEPGNQLCTDDFKGHSSRNANLAVKAIMGIVAYAELCKMRGDEVAYNEHMGIAHEYAHYWVDHARSTDGKWYYMEFENSTHWGLKYNMLWDKLWKWNIFNDSYTGDVIATDIEHYKTKINTWGLPLDSRDATGKSDWVAWIAAMTESQADLELFMDPEWKWANETVDRLPLSDWHWTDSRHVRGFRARSVIGGLWAPVLRKKAEGTLPDVVLGIHNATENTSPRTEVTRYNLNGQRITAPKHGLNIIKYSDGTVKKVLVK